MKLEAEVTIMKFCELKAIIVDKNDHYGKKKSDEKKLFYMCESRGLLYTLYSKYSEDLYDAPWRT